MAIFNPDPEATEPQTFTMPFGGLPTLPEPDKDEKDTK